MTVTNYYINAQNVQQDELNKLIVLMNNTIDAQLKASYEIRIARKQKMISEIREKITAQQSPYFP